MAVQDLGTLHQAVDALAQGDPYHLFELAPVSDASTWREVAAYILGRPVSDLQDDECHAVKQMALALIHTTPGRITKVSTETQLSYTRYAIERFMALGARRTGR